MNEMESERTLDSAFVQSRLPWLLALGGLAIYLLTVGWGLSFGLVGHLVRILGWSWQPVLVAPVTWLVTYPIRWLPEAWQIAALNIFTLVCASYILALLARSVAILPHDRTRDQRMYEHSEFGWLSTPTAWVPPLLAVAVCGLQLSFWESAAFGSPEILDLLLFAYCVRCLLEYRVDERESWLTRMALVYGLGITNNFAMISFLPGFVAAVIWLRGRSFFQFAFFGRMFLWGVVGLLFYFLLPLVQVLSGDSNVGFWEALRLNFAFQKNMLAAFPRYTLLLTGFGSLLPVVFMAIRWPDTVGDVNVVGSALTHLMTHVMHLLFLGATVYLAFDPAFSPRNLAGPRGYTMLPLYFLGALSAGYYCGYFLLVFGPSTQTKVWQRSNQLRLALTRIVPPALCIGTVAVIALLAWRNFPQVRNGTRPHLARLAERLRQGLNESAPKGAIVLSDEPYRLYGLQWALAKTGQSRNYPVLETAALTFPTYHRHLQRTYGSAWQSDTNISNSRAGTVSSPTLIRMLLQANQSRDIYYLHPSFGYYFEAFYSKPRGLVYQLKPYPTNDLSGPVLSRDEIQQNTAFWARLKTQPDMAALIAELGRRSKQNPLQSVWALRAGMPYAQSANDLGVELQRAGQFDQAEQMFSLALQLNPENPAAFANLDYARLLKAGKTENPEPSEGVVKRLQPYGGDFSRLLGLNGPLAEPNLCYRLAETLAKGGNIRQSAQQLQRILAFQPTNVSARVPLISLLPQLGFSDKALELINQTRSKAPPSGLHPDLQMQLISCEAWAYVGRNEFPRAEQLLLAAQKTHPDRAEPFGTLAEIYVSQGRMSNAVDVLSRLLQRQPKNPGALINLARLKIMADDRPAAIKLLDRALAVDDRNTAALLNRAIANLDSSNAVAAQADYEKLNALLPTKSYAVIYGLHQAAWLTTNRTLATKYGREFLKIAPPGTPEIPRVKERLIQIKTGKF